MVLELKGRKLIAGAEGLERRYWTTSIKRGTYNNKP
jgi:hypothetical protein